MQYDSICRMKPYVYEIQNKYYCIGFAVFRACTDEEISLYKEVNTTVKKLKEKHREHDHSFLEKSVYDDFIKLINLCNAGCNNSDEKRCKLEYEKLLRKYRQEDYEKINIQIENFIELLNLKDEIDFRQISLTKKGQKT